MLLGEAGFRYRISQRHLIDYGKLDPSELVTQCVATRDAAAWQEFVQRFQPLIAGVVARTATRWTNVTAGLVDDLVQETYLKLCTEEFRRLREFESRHQDAIYGFLKAVAYTVTMDYFKVHNAAKRGARLRANTDFDLSLQVAGQETHADDQVLLREIDELVAQVAENERDKVVFLLYYRQGLTAKTIATVPGIDLSEKGVESCLHRLTEKLRKKVVGRRQ